MYPQIFGWLECAKIRPEKFQILQTVPLFKLQALSHINENVIYPFSNEQLSSAQKNDRILSEVGLWLLQGGPDQLQHFDIELLYFVELYDRLYLKDDVIFIQMQDESDFDAIFGYS